MAELPKDKKAPHRSQGVKYEFPSERQGEACRDCKHVIVTETPRCETVSNPIFLTGRCARFERKIIGELHP